MQTGPNQAEPPHEEGNTHRGSPLRGGKAIFCALALICAGLLAADFFYEKDADFVWDGWWGFYALFGFVAFFGLVLTGKPLRRILMRREDYYDQ